jgi:hypothetical protein
MTFVRYVSGKVVSFNGQFGENKHSQCLNWSGVLQLFNNGWLLWLYGTAVNCNPTIPMIPGIARCVSGSLVHYCSALFGVILHSCGVQWWRGVCSVQCSVVIVSLGCLASCVRSACGVALLNCCTAVLL